VTGLYRIDEAVLNALENEDFLTLRQSGALLVADAQLLSMNQIAVLKQLAQIQTQFHEPDVVSMRLFMHLAVPPPAR
jgi:hypothetical protein